MLKTPGALACKCCSACQRHLLYYFSLEASGWLDPRPSPGIMLSLHALSSTWDLSLNLAIILHY